MAILNYTTNIDSIKTISEIQQILVKHGAIKITTDYDGQIPIGVTFCLNMNGRMAGFALPCNFEGVLKALQRGKVPSKLRTKEQALKVSWRILKDWVAAQCAIVEANLVEMPEVFLPYAVTPNGNTIWKEIKANPNQLLLT